MPKATEVAGDRARLEGGFPPPEGLLFWARAPCVTWWGLLAAFITGMERGSPGVAGRTRQGGRGRMGAGSPRGAAHCLSDLCGGGGGGRCLRGGPARPPGGC